jgi:hypothetical protein
MLAVWRLPMYRSSSRRRSRHNNNNNSPDSPTNRRAPCAWRHWRPLARAGTRNSRADSWLLRSFAHHLRLLTRTRAHNRSHVATNRPQKAQRPIRGLAPGAVDSALAGNAARAGAFVAQRTLLLIACMSGASGRVRGDLSFDGRVYVSQRQRNGRARRGKERARCGSTWPLFVRRASATRPVSPHSGDALPC